MCNYYKKVHTFYYKGLFLFICKNVGVFITVGITEWLPNR